MDTKVANIHEKKGKPGSLSDHGPVRPLLKNELKDFVRIEDQEKIVEMLVVLKYEQSPSFLVSKDGRNFGNTVLTEFSHNVLTIEKPIELSQSPATPLGFYFKDKHKIWNFFEIRILDESDGSLRTTYPQAVFQLQRRVNKRVNAPPSTSVFFYRKEVFLYGGHVKDLSATGMLVFGREKQAEQLKKNSEFDEIVVNLPDKKLPRINKVIKAEYTLVIGKGKVVRTFYDKKLKCMHYGVSFEDDNDRFQKALIKYFD